MIDLLDKNTIFKTTVNNLSDYAIEPLPKVVDKRGYIYLIKDSSFPTVFKIGRTISLETRLLKYNSDKPFKTAFYYKISKAFMDVHSVEKTILEQIYKVTNPTSLTKEWFYIEHLALAEEWICRAEEQATLYIQRR